MNRRTIEIHHTDAGPVALIIAPALSVQDRVALIVQECWHELDDQLDDTVDTDDYPYDEASETLDRC